MGTKTLFILSMFNYTLFENVKVFKGDQLDLYTDGLLHQEITLKSGLCRHNIDGVVLYVNVDDFETFNDKEFSLKDFDVKATCSKETEVSKLLTRIKEYALNSNLCESTVELNKHLFSSSDPKDYLSEYVLNEKTHNTVNNYLKNKSKNEIDNFMHTLFVYSDKKAICNKDNINVKITIALYGDGDGLFDLTLIANNMKQLSTVSEHVDLVLDTRGFANNDYYFLKNMFQLVESDMKHYSVVGILDIIKNSDCYIDTVINEQYIPDSSVILSLLKTYSATGKLTALHTLDDYLKSRFISTKFLQRYISSLSFIESGVALCNIATLKFGISALKKAHELPTDVQHIGENTKFIVAIFRNMIEKKFGLLIETEKLRVINLIIWCIENEYYQQTLTIIESLVPQDIVENGVLYYATNRENADEMIERWNYYYWKENPRTRYNFDDLGHYFIKNYGRTAINNSQPKKQLYLDLVDVYIKATKGEVPELGLFYKNVSDDQLIKDLLLSYYRIGNLRNEVAHAMPQKEKTLEDIDNLGEDETYEKVKKEISLFRDLYKSAIELCDGPKPYIIFNKTFKEYTRAHRIDPKETKS